MGAKTGVDGTLDVSIYSGTITANLGSFAPSGQASLSVSTTSARVSVGTASTVVIYNPGTVTAYVAFGSGTVTVTTSNGAPVPAGAMIAFALGSNTYVAGITASGTATLAIAVGAGLPAIGLASSGGGGSNAAVGATGSTAPGSADQIGGVDGGGNLQPLTAQVLHTGDNQNFGSTSRGLLTGGVAQLVNPVGTADRQRETGFDNIPAQGVAAGAQQLASPPLSTTTTAAITSTGSQAVNVAATVFTNRGVTQSIQAGSTVLIGGANPEYVYVTAATATSITGTFANTHASGVSVTAFSYSQQRDATIPDGSTPAGIAAGGAYLFNAPAVSVEFERSFSGELAGATGTGAAVAVEYEDTAGGPPNASGVATGLRLQQGQNLLGKGRTSATITTSSAGNTSIVFASAPNLQPGHAVQLSGSGTLETVYTAASGYTPGTSTTIPIQNAVVNTGQTTAAWDTFSANGPGLNGFLPHGVAVEEEALYDPVSGLYFIERAATQDGVSGQNIVIESVGLYNGSTFDRARSLSSLQASSTLTGLPAAGVMGIYNTTPPTLTTGQLSQLQMDASANLRVTIAGSLTTLNTAIKASAGYGGTLTTPFTNATGTPAAQAGKASAATLYGGQVWNTQSSTWVYLHLFNVAFGSVTVGTTAAVLVVAVPPAAVVNLADVVGPTGAAFSSALSYLLSGGASTTDSTAIGTAAVAGCTLEYA